MRIAARQVPTDVIYRPKMGFGMPLADWFLGPLGDFVESLMADSQAMHEDWVRIEPVRAALTEHRAGKDHSTRLWLFLWFELWLRWARTGKPGHTQTLGTNV